MNDGRLLVFGLGLAGLGLAGLRRGGSPLRTLAQAPKELRWSRPEKWFLPIGAGKRAPRGFRSKGVVSIGNLPTEIKVGDTVWALDDDGIVTQKVGVFTRGLMESFVVELTNEAIDKAESVLPLFEKSAPSDGRPRQAVESARLIMGRLSNPTKAMFANADAASRGAVNASYDVGLLVGPDSPAPHAATVAHNAAEAAFNAVDAVAFKNDKASPYVVGAVAAAHALAYAAENGLDYSHDLNLLARQEAAMFLLGLLEAAP